MLNNEHTKDDNKSKGHATSFHEYDVSLHEEEDKELVVAKFSTGHKPTNSIESNNGINHSREELKLNDIQIEDKHQSLNKSIDNKNSEEENEGGEDIAMAQFQGSNSKNKVPYNPNYDVFNKEERPYTLRTENTSEIGTTDLNTKYYYDHIASENDQMKEFRKAKLVPSKAVMMTEIEEQRLKELRSKFEVDFVKMRTQNIGSKAQTKDLTTFDRSKLTDKELAELKEKERTMYYRENVKKRLTVLRIKAIEFDWLFEDEGMKFMHSIAQSESIELFSLDIIKTIVLFFWQYYKIRIIFSSFLPFLLNFLVMLAYTTYIHVYNNNRENNVTTDWSNFKNWDSMKYADYALMIIILILSIYQFILEILYLLQMRKRYFTSFWNLINLLSIGLNIASIVIDYKNIDESKYWIPVSSSAMIIMWLRLFYFGRIINATSTIVRMIIEISKDMVPFLVIVFIIVFGFSN